MKLLLISLCTTGVMREHFISYSKMFSKNNELYCVTNDNVTNDELNAIETLNVCYKRNKPFSYFSLKSLKKIKNFIKSVSPEVVYVFTPHPVNILLARFLKRYNVIFQVHDPIAHSGTGLLDKIVLNKQLKQYYKISKKFIVAGEELKRQILLTSHVTEDKIEVIPLGLVDNFSDLEKTTDETCDIDLLFYGRIEYYKGLDTLATALSKLPFKVSTYIVGKGDVKAVYGPEINFDNNVKIISEFVPDEELASLIRRSKIVVMPYRDATGTMTVGQSFYFSKPVIASNVGVFPEYVATGGMIFDRENPDKLAECIEKLLTDRSLYDKLSENAGKIYEEKFTLSRVCQRHQDVFDCISLQ